MMPDRFLPRCGDWLCTRPEHRPFAWQAHPAEPPDSARQDVLDVALAIIVLVLVALAGSLVAVR